MLFSYICYSICIFVFYCFISFSYLLCITWIGHLHVPCIMLYITYRFINQENIFFHERKLIINEENKLFYERKLIKSCFTNSIHH